MSAACIRLSGVSVRALTSMFIPKIPLRKRGSAVTFPAAPMRYESTSAHGEAQALSLENNPDDYKTARSRLDSELSNLLIRPERFQSIHQREDRCDMAIEACKMNGKGRGYVTYKGCNLLSSPEDYVLYHQLFYYQRPKTVIELGTCEGGSTIWFGDQLKLLGIKGGHVYSMDIDPSLLSKKAKELNPDNVTFLTGDCNEIEKTFTPEMLSKLPRPWAIIDDAHANLSGTLGYLHRYLVEGDYIVVEDTNPYIPREIGVEASAIFDEIPLAGTQKLEKLKAFLRKYDDFYAVDSFLTDFYGYNCSWMWHGFIRRMKN